MSRSFKLSRFPNKLPSLNFCPGDQYAKVGEIPTVRSSDTDTDLPIVSADLFTNF